MTFPKRLMLSSLTVSLFTLPLLESPSQAQPVDPDSVACFEGFTIETPGYFASICYNENGSFYVGRAKDDRGEIALPLDYSANDIYIARNGEYIYMVDMNARQLIITDPAGEQTVEAVIREFDS